MGKISVFLSSGLGFIGLLRILLPGIAVDFFSLDLSVALLAVAVAGLTFAYQYTSLAKVDLSEVWAILGLVLGGTFLVMLYTPTLGSLRQYYISASDMLLVAESAVVCGLAYTRRKPAAAPLTAYISMASLLFISLRWRSLNFPSQQTNYRQKHAH